MTDLPAMTAEEFTAHAAAVAAEGARRSILATYPSRITAELAGQQAAYLDARDHTGPYTAGTPTPPPAWQPPAGLYDCYPKGRTVTHAGRVWKSGQDSNASEPGTDTAWSEVAATVSG